MSQGRGATECDATIMQKVVRTACGPFMFISDMVALHNVLWASRRVKSRNDEESDAAKRIQLMYRRNHGDEKPKGAEKVKPLRKRVANAPIPVNPYRPHAASSLSN